MKDILLILKWKLTKLYFGINIKKDIIYQSRGIFLKTFDNYLFRQQIKPFIFFSFVLVGILWLIQSMPKLDDVISNGQSGLVFIKISMLIFPQVMLIVLPISAFASTIYALHKSISESEL